VLSINDTAESTHGVLGRALELLGEKVQESGSQFGDGTLVLRREDLRDACIELRLDAELQLDMLVDITVVDYLGEEPRFELVVHLGSLNRPDHRLRIKCRAPESDPVYPSLVPVWAGAEFLEREAFDMFGVRFEGHPDLRRVLLYEEFEGFPLRKDYPKTLCQPLFVPEYEGERKRIERSHFDTDCPGLLEVDPENPSAIGRSQVPPYSGYGMRPDGSYRVRHRLEPEGDPLASRMLISLGPSHPFTHGTIRIIAELDGETVVGVDVIPGFLHRGFEKEGEAHTYQQLIPYTDRLNYCSPLINNFAMCEAVEKMLDLEVPRRAQYIRVIMGELSRIGDHLTAIAAVLMETGAMTPFLYLMEAREWLWEHLAHVTGARLTHSYGRIGGVEHDIDAEWIRRCNEIIEKNIFPMVRNTHGLLDTNRVFVDRHRGTGVLTQADAVAYGFTGPILRSTGIPRDVRVIAPYGAYGEFAGVWKVPIGKYGDNYDRYFVRMREIEESVRIVRAAFEGLPEGPIRATDYRAVLPSKKEVYSNIEAVIAHFKLVFEGVRPPVGEVYHPVEGANGEVGVYLVSDGSGRPYRCRVRPPSFIHMGGAHKMMLGQQLADLVPVFGNINMIGGECDR